MSRHLRNWTKTYSAILGNGSDESDGEDMVELPGMLPPLKMKDDTDNCTMVLIFPRSKDVGGVVDPEAIVEDPWAKLGKIFVATANTHSAVTLDRLKSIIGPEAVSMERYQMVVRKCFTEIVSESGLLMSSFPSIDEDEDFLKLYLPLGGDTIKEMAEHLEYSMPYKTSVYANVRPHGPYEGKEPMKDAMGRDLVAWDAYSKELAAQGCFEDFTKMDSIRLLEFWLDEWVSLDEMERQGIITCYFPCPDVKALQGLHRSFLDLRAWVHFQGDQADSFRDYFGAEIGFYFRFLGYVCHAMTLLGVLGALVYLFRHPLLRGETFIPQAYLGRVRSGLAAVYSIWAAILLVFWAITTSRIRLRWGVDDAEDYEQINPEWEQMPPSGRWPLVVNVLTCLFVLCYVGAITAVLGWQFSFQNQDDPGMSATLAPLILTAIIKIGSLLWTYIAPALVWLENHRREEDKLEKLSSILAVVKIFVALFPFISSCFLATLAQKTCGETFEHAMRKTWADYDPLVPLSPDALEAITKYSFQLGNETCFMGCHPADLQKATEWSSTTCDNSVTTNLQTYFLFNVLLELVFLVIPIVTSYCAIDAERRKQQESNSNFKYTLLQWEAKKFKYEWNSWGGDKINDYLDLAISYAVVVCFGIIAPVMATVAVIAMLISLRLRCYRMIYVTRRPLPRASAGLGVWESVFSGINVVAVIINVGLAAVFFYPMRIQSNSVKFALFVIAEHVVLFIEFVVRLIVPAKPVYISHVEAYNSHVKKVVHVGQSAMLRLELHKTDVSHVNLDLNSRGAGVQSDSESTDEGSSSNWC